MSATSWEEKVDKVSGHLLRLVFVGMVFMVFKNLDTIILVLRTPGF